MTCGRAEIGERRTWHCAWSAWRSCSQSASHHGEITVSRARSNSERHVATCTCATHRLRVSSAPSTVTDSISRPPASPPRLERRPPAGVIIARSNRRCIASWSRSAWPAADSLWCLRPPWRPWPRSRERCLPFELRDVWRRPVDLAAPTGVDATEREAERCERERRAGPELRVLRRSELWLRCRSRLADLTSRLGRDPSLPLLLRPRRRRRLELRVWLRLRLALAPERLR